MVSQSINAPLFSHYTGVLKLVMKLCGLGAHLDGNIYALVIDLLSGSDHEDQLTQLSMHVYQYLYYADNIYINKRLLVNFR